MMIFCWFLNILIPCLLTQANVKNVNNMTLSLNDKRKEKKNKENKLEPDIDVTKDLTQAQIVVSALDLAIQVFQI